MNLAVYSANIVVLAERHNPAIVSKEWLAANKIIAEEAINFTHAPVFSLCESANFVIVVQEERLQIIAKNPEEGTLRELPRIVDRYLRKLPETPYRAVGINFLWAERSDDESELQLISRRLFAAAPDVFAHVTGSNDYTVGGILRWSQSGLAVRLVVERKVDDGALLDLNFNYHQDIAGSHEACAVAMRFEELLANSRYVASHLLKDVHVNVHPTA